MNVQLLLRHGNAVFDATPILTDGVEWSASVLGRAGKLRFSVVRDGIVNFTEGDQAVLLADGETLFSGWVMTKEKSSEQIISVTVYDQMFYLARNRGTYVYQNKTAAELVRTVAADFGLQTGEISDSGWKIPQRIEEGETLMDILLSALEISGKASGREFFLFDRAGKLTVKERQEMAVQAVLRCDGGISDYWYKTDISRDTFNTVRLYHAGRKENERLAMEAERAGQVEKWGRLQYYRHVPYALNGAQLREMAEGILMEKCRVKKELTLENINGNVMLFAGNSVWVDIPDLAEISLQGMALIESCTHIFRDGEHRTRMDMRIEEG